MDFEVVLVDTWRFLLLGSGVVGQVRIIRKESSEQVTI